MLVDQVVWHVVELAPQAFDAFLSFMAGIEHDVQNQIEGGANVIAIACAFNLTPPGFDDTSPTAAKLQLDGVPVRLFPILKQASVGGAIKVTHCAYPGADYTNPHRHD